MQTKSLLLSALMLCGSAMLSAQTPADQLRIYLNPGHGSWTSGDRPMDTLREVNGQLTVVHPGTDSNNKVNSPDTTAFYESNTNIRKVLAVVDRLEMYGLKIDRTKNQNNPNKYRVGAALDLSNNIVMSHVMAGPYPHDPNNSAICNRNLTEIREEVEVNNFDMFFSLHSNAASGSYTNYLSVLYRGYSNINNAAGVTLGSGDATGSPDLVPGSQKMAIICADQALKMAHQHWTERKTSAVGSGAVVGDIDFYHSSSINMNNGKGYRGYLGVLKHGVPGFLAEGYFHTYMPSKQRAMNWDADRMEGVEFARGIANIFGLQKEKTGDIFGVVRDKFTKFEHTYYKALASSTDAMLPLNGVTVVLYDENDNEVARYKTDNHYNGVYVFENVKPGNYTITVEKDGYQMLKDEDYYIVVNEATTTYSETWMADNSYVQPEITYEDYVDPMADIHHVGVAGSYDMAQKYVNRSASEFTGNTVNRTIVRNGYLFTVGNNTIGVADLATGNGLRTITTDGIEKVEDIAMTADNVLIAVSGGKLYRWKNDPVGLPAALPRQMGDKTAERFPSDIYTIAYSGTLEDGTAYLMTEKGKDLYVLNIKDGEITTVHTEDMSEIAPEAGVKLYVSPLHEKALMAKDNDKSLTELSIADRQGARPTIIASVNDDSEFKGNNVAFFKMAGGTFMVVPAKSTSGSNGISMTDITNGLDKRRKVETTNCSFSNANPISVNGQCYVNYDSRSGAFKSYYFDLYATSTDGKTTRITTEGVEQTRELASYAYDLKCEGSDMVNFTFKSTGNAPEANLILTNVDDANDVITVPLGAVKEGENTVTYDPTSLAEGKTYRWGIEVVSNAIPESGKVWAAFPSGKTPNNSGKSTTPRDGLVVFTDPALPTYGYSVMSLGYNQGLWIYAPDHTLVGTYAAGDEKLDSSNHSSLFRGTTRGAKTVWADYSDKGAGYWEFDPLNPEAGIKNILAGTNDGTGAHIYDGKNIGGSATDIAFFGAGDDEVLWVAAQDTPEPKTSNNIIRYRSAGKSIIDMAPDQVWNGSNGFPDTKGMCTTSTVAGLLPTERGLFVSAIRTSNKNTVTTPAFVLYDYNGKELLNSANIEDFVAGGTGIAISPDYSTLYASEGSKGIAVLNLEWNNGVPTATKAYNMSLSGTEHYQMYLDPAGNLAVVSRGAGYELYTLRNNDPRCTTPALPYMTITNAGAGVDNVLQDASNNDDAPVEYFDLQGRRVINPAAGSILIRRQGANVTKIVVK